MADTDTVRVLEHDPERGCAGCPFDSIRWSEPRPFCGATGRGPTVNDNFPAPDWCPLRQGVVVVRRPSRDGTVEP